jgi:hypothetical protein
MPYAALLFDIIKDDAAARAVLARSLAAAPRAKDRQLLEQEIGGAPPRHLPGEECAGDSGARIVAGDGNYRLRAATLSLREGPAMPDG